MNLETLLLRQINPSFIQNGRVTSQAFRPTPKDENKLSVYDGDQITPEDSWRHFTLNPLCSSAGVMAVSQRHVLNKVCLLSLILTLAEFLFLNTLT